MTIENNNKKLIDPESNVAVKGGYFCLTCNRCGHIWYSKKDPKNCTSCKSPYWNRMRVNKKSNIIKNTKQSSKIITKSNNQKMKNQNNKNSYQFTCNICKTTWYSNQKMPETCVNIKCQSPHWNKTLIR